VGLPGSRPPGILKEGDRLGAVSIGLDLFATIREHVIPETGIA
jgi:hypothetical protein